MLSPPFTLAGFNVLLEGPSGTGKTHSIGTLVDSGVEVFYLATEAGVEALAGYWADRSLPIPDNLHWMTVAAAEVSFDTFIASAKQVNTLPLDALAKLSDNNRAKHNQFIKILEGLNKFTDERTGEDFGSAQTWDQSRAIVVDGMTGINNAALSMVVGGKPVRSMSDWGIAQNMVEQLLRMLCDLCKCHFILIGHVERETDPVLGGVKITISTLGKALSPKIPAMFSDVILAERTGEKWTWNTASAMADLKTRNLPYKADLAPSFAPIIEKWKQRNSAGEAK